MNELERLIPISEQYARSTEDLIYEFTDREWSVEIEPHPRGKVEVLVSSPAGESYSSIRNSVRLALAELVVRALK